MTFQAADYTSALHYTYDGSLVTGVSWSGAVAGSVSAGYDNFFRVNALSVNGADAVSFGYDDDGLLTQAGSLTLTRDGLNGRMTGTTLGSVNDTWTYPGFGEARTYTATAGAGTLYAVDFPCVQQVARLRRPLRQHSPATVALVTSLGPEDLNAAQWLEYNRAAWGIERGLHQRLDVSHRDDQCRVRQPHAMRVIGMFRRLSNSLFMHWRSRQKKPRHKTTTDFFGAMNAEHHRYAIRCLQARQPSFRTAS